VGDDLGVAGVGRLAAEHDRRPQRPAEDLVEERERILDFFEATAGSRMMCNYMRFTGVSKDLPERIRSVANLMNDKIRDYDTMQFLTEISPPVGSFSPLVKPETEAIYRLSERIKALEVEVKELKALLTPSPPPEDDDRPWPGQYL